MLPLSFKDDAKIWWQSLDRAKMMALSVEAFEKIFLDRWSCVGKTYTEHTEGLFSSDNSILHVHRYIQQEKVIVSINPSCQQNFVNLQLVNRLHVPAKNIQSTQVESKNVQIFKYLKIVIDKCVVFKFLCYG
jgi:hypothetical protein